MTMLTARAHVIISLRPSLTVRERLQTALRTLQFLPTHASGMLLKTTNQAAHRAGPVEEIQLNPDQMSCVARLMHQLLHHLAKHQPQFPHPAILVSGRGTASVTRGLSVPGELICQTVVKTVKIPANMLKMANVMNPPIVLLGPTLRIVALVMRMMEIRVNGQMMECVMSRLIATLALTPLIAADDLRIFLHLLMNLLHTCPRKRRHQSREYQPKSIKQDLKQQAYMMIGSRVRLKY